MTQTVWRELMALTKGNRGHTALLLEGLERLARRDDRSALTELAREVLENRTSLREAVLSSAYATELGEGVRAMRSAVDERTPEERRELVAEASAAFRQLANDEAAGRDLLGG